jgi:hypothetical protein
MENAKKFVNEHESNEVTFVGHSKGGAEATANAIATNRGAILFNPMAISAAANGLLWDEINYNHPTGITAYIVDGEILNRIFSISHSWLVKKITLKQNPAFPTPLLQPWVRIPNSIELHYIPSIRYGLSELND